VIGTWIFTILSVPSRTPILTYHDIIPARTKGSVWFDCTVSEFKEQIGWLKKKGAVFVSSTDVHLSYILRKPLPKNAICITFADNYQGFYRYAWPILKAAKIPVTQFVHTGFVGSKIGRPKMTWNQLIELDRTGLVTIASQTVTHPADLTKMSDQEVLSEFTKSRSLLESKLGHRVLELAYPNGKYDARISALAKKAGYAAAFTEDCEPAEKGRNQYEIPRYVHTKYKRAWETKVSKH
jgi:peptidoglycan/xylan/chitin deacetylase (PgdA/CDA1 family)